MSALPEYETFDATALGGLVSDGEVSPGELVEAAVDRIERLNPALNAVVHKTYDLARAAAAEPPPAGSPFPGVPFLLKDLHADLKGEPTTGGSRSMADHIPDHDSEIVSRHKAAGLLILGKTNTPEFGLAPGTEPELHGPTVNPWDSARTPGGSSGGSAAAVAAGLVPMAHASDGGGSIRIPASACGLFGLKPTRGRNPTGPSLAEGWYGLSEEHAVTRSVRDSARLLDATQGPDIGAAHIAPPPVRPFADEVGADPGRLRVAFDSGTLLSSGIDPECREAVEAAARLCEELGHEVAEASPAIDKEALAAAFVTLAVSGGAFDASMAERLKGSALAGDDLELTQWVMKKAGDKISGAELSWAMYTAKQSARTVGRFMSSHDVFMTSTLASPPWPTGDLAPAPSERMVLRAVKAVPAKPLLDSLVKRLSGELLRPIPNTPLFNMTGQPAMSAPLHWTDGGLPVGVQFVGRHGDEATLFRLAAQLEETRPWFNRRPPLAGGDGPDRLTGEGPARG